MSDANAVHEAAAEGFARGAKAYERGRPGYSPQAVSWLAAQLGLASGVRVLDLAAGTGKLTRLLTSTGASVVAVEPIDEMRAALADVAPGVAVPRKLGQAWASGMGCLLLDAKDAVDQAKTAGLSALTKQALLELHSSRSKLSADADYAAARIGLSASAAKCSGGSVNVKPPSRSSVCRTFKSVSPITAPDSS